MKKSRVSDSQIIDALKRAEAGLAVPELCRDLGISSATFYKWRAKHSRSAKPAIAMWLSAAWEMMRSDSGCCA
jgi:transposase-like protein